MSNTKDQTVKITLKEYLEYQELLEHKKEVRIVETTTYLENNIQGIGVTWHSDGQTWVQLSHRLSKSGEMIAKLVKKNNKLIDYIEAGFFERLRMEKPE